jgi:predicted nucleic acid-binding protein
LAIAAMQQGRVVDLDALLSLEAARLSLEYKLPLADSVILATARANKAVLWTQDADFDGLAGVKFTAR